MNVRRVLFVSLHWLLYALLTPFVFIVAKRWPIARPHLPRRTAVHLLFALLFCAAWAGAGTLLRMSVSGAPAAGRPASRRRAL
ncbi:MAG: hypothetical protein ACXW5U_20975 [Thermoanaerobaculia bacterium]